jgi:hypothetical protein
MVAVGSGGHHLINDDAFSSEVFFHPCRPLSVFKDGGSWTRSSRAGLGRLAVTRSLDDINLTIPTSTRRHGHTT